MAAEKRQRVSDPLEAIAELSSAAQWFGAFSRPLQPLGRGVFASVYTARLKSSTGVFAVKIQPADNRLVRNELDALRLFSGERVAPLLHGAFTATGAELAAMLDQEGHEYAGGRLRGWALDDDRLYSVTVQEQLAQPLGEVYKGKKQTIDTYRAHMRALIDAVARMHAAGWVHRDLHTGNIMLSHSGELRLIDFGLAVKVTSGAGRLSDELLRKDVHGLRDNVMKPLLLHTAPQFFHTWTRDLLDADTLDELRRSQVMTADPLTSPEDLPLPDWLVGV